MRHAVTFAVLVALAAPAHANVAAPWIEGSAGAEASGIGTIRITHEELTIDLRPVDAHARADVRVVYHLDNPGAETPLDLVFVSGSMVTKFDATLDGSALTYKMSTPREVAAPWQAPRSTLDFDGDQLEYKADIAPVAFHMTLPPGTHDLVINYSARTAGYHVHEPTVKRQFAYVLAPARTWGGFGGLDVTVQLPPGWRAIASPTLQRTGDTMTGSFPSIPADFLTVTLQARPGMMYGLVKNGTRALLLFLIVAGGFVIHRRAKARPDMTFASAFAHGLLWSAVVLTIGLVAIFTPDSLLPEYQADRRGYGEAFATMGLMLLSFVLLIVGAVMARKVSASPAKARDGATKLA